MLPGAGSSVNAGFFSGGVREALEEMASKAAARGHGASENAARRQCTGREERTVEEGHKGARVCVCENAVKAGTWGCV